MLEPSITFRNSRRLEHFERLERLERAAVIQCPGQDENHAAEPVVGVVPEPVR